MLKLIDVPRPFALLPPGLIQATTEEFITVFATSPMRRQLIEKYLKFRRELDPILPGATHLIGGSFVEGRVEPCDIDTVVFFDRAMFDALPPDQKRNIWQLIGVKNNSKALYNTDVYGVPLAKPGHKDYADSWKNLGYWMPFFGLTRTGLPKGMIRLFDNKSDDALSSFLLFCGMEVLK